MSSDIGLDDLKNSGDIKKPKEDEKVYISESEEDIYEDSPRTTTSDVDPDEMIVVEEQESPNRFLRCLKVVTCCCFDYLSSR